MTTAGTPKAPDPDFAAAVERYGEAAIEFGIVCIEDGGMGDRVKSGRDDIATARQALLAQHEALQAEVGRVRAEREWQPIETAPKDGTEILAAVHSFGFPSELSIRIIWYYPSKFFWSCQDYGEPTSDWCIPTHWMPLPARSTLSQATGTEVGK